MHVSGVDKCLNWIELYHSIGLKVKEKQESNPGRQSDDRMGENSRGEANLKSWVLSFERNVETDNELRVSGGREF